MSRNRLDMVDTYEQFGHDHWKTLGTIVGGVEVVKSVLQGTSKVTVEPVQSFTGTVTLPAVKEPKRLTDYKNVSLNLEAANLFATVKSLPAMPKRIFKRVVVNKSLDEAKIIEALGGQRAAIVKSVEELEVAIGQFIEEASEHLNTKGKCNLFYVLDPEGTKRELLSIKVFQVDSVWYVCCHVAGEREWVCGSRAFKQLPRRA